MKSSLAGQVLLPGDRVLTELPKTGKLRLAPGVHVLDGDKVIATHAGVLNQAKSGKLWLKTSQKRYVAAMGEVIVGIIQDRNAEVFLVDIHGCCMAELPVTAFENATKRNVPALKGGDLVHARITSAHHFCNPTLSCVDSNGKAAGMGALKGGSTVYISTGFARSLLSTPVHPVLSLLGTKIKFEIVIGMNGLVWVHAHSAEDLIHLTEVLEKCDHHDRITTERICRKQLENRF